MRRLKWLASITTAWTSVLCLVTGAVSAASFDLDPSFGVHGRVTFSTGQQQALIGRSVLQSDGKLIVTGSRAMQIGGLPGAELFAFRFNVDGMPDASFGANGESRFSVRGNDAINMITLQADGKIVLAVSAQEPCTLSSSPFAGCINNAGQTVALVSAIVRLRTDGSLDTTFGGKGFVEATDFYGGYAVAVQPDGKLLLLGSTSVARAHIFNWRLARFNTDGARDAGFNGGQTVSSRCEAFGYSVLAQPDGGIVVGGDDGVFYADSAVNPGVCIERLLSNGSHDLDFNQGSLRTNFGINVSLASLTALPDGKFLAVGRGIRVTDSPTQYNYESGVIAARYAANGVLDAAYGHGGAWFFPVADSYWFVDFTFARDGGIVAAGYEYPSPPFDSPQQYRTALLKVTQDGQADTAFGVNGIARSAFGASPLTGFLRDVEYHWLLISETTLSDLNTGGLVERYNGEYLDSVPVVEFYNTNLDHYFITADSIEAAQIDGGSAGPGWSRTGNSFRSGGNTFVCRFYGSQSPGPNSHFYTADPGECDFLKQLQAGTPTTQKRWNFESLDFASTPATNGACPGGTVPVYRAYNNGFARGVDSNHRITSNPTAIQEVITRGWSNEGVVMCAPN
ncbi:MAG: hypothetical protein Q8O37_15400 [Sulfuricellaceae bacterium]|nr:hypothetical protein [Sulfuricellaceae bacterium]